jgi:hypothetical protein
MRLMATARSFPKPPYVARDVARRCVEWGRGNRNPLPNTTGRSGVLHQGKVFRDQLTPLTAAAG